MSSATHLAHLHQNAAKIFLPSPSYGGPVVFLDLDNTLYPVSAGVSKHMSIRMRSFVKDKLGWNGEEATAFIHRYYRDFGLSIKGMVKWHGVDPLVYDRMVDGSIPLETLLKPDPRTTQLVTTLCERYPTYILTNAALPHSLRVLDLLNLADLFPRQRIIACDYAEPDFPCKPFPIMWAKAMELAGLNPENADDRKRCLFIDDAPRNCVGALEYGWIAVHIAAADVSHTHTPSEPFQDEEDLESPNFDPSPPTPTPVDRATDPTVLSTTQLPSSVVSDIIPRLPPRESHLPWWPGAPWPSGTRVPLAGEKWYSPYAHFGVDELSQISEVLPGIL
ncbi:pyrimidine 5-nucleotidase [Gonapodya prolifera JEL478]|uniref:Pyrimidine 5-nucleotidase n=1 Tax=Gonapodya prolifera (strain JEL478) TaxID=1344416 RepID=A0A139ACK0_GONPJ|nr:pyrimidine 5-nucleotidase [Gonapodya prolifera JEL478]|eukprot:KXS14542.1 pyrimidine 5-nucleotidase [Gonapodya prolifera JEL478]